MANPLGELFVKISADTKPLQAGFKNAERSSQGLMQSMQRHSRKIGMAMAAMGGAILAAGALSIKTFAKMGDEVAKMARKTGFSTEALSELRFAAELSGTTLTSLEKAVKRMSGTILDAQDGLETYIRAFEHIGIEVSELDGLNPEEQFLKIAEAIAELEDPTKRTALAMDIFGRAGADLIPMFDKGKEGLDEMRQAAHDAGMVFDLEAAQKAEKFTDAMFEMEESVNGVKMVIADQLIPILIVLLEKIKQVVIGMTEWAKQHETLTKVMVFLTTALGGLLITLAPVIIMIDSLLDIWMALRVVLMTKLIPALHATGVAMWAAIGPVGLMIIALAALVAISLVVWKNWELIEKDVMEIWNYMAKGAQFAFKAMGKAVEWMIEPILRAIEWLNQLWAALMRIMGLGGRPARGPTWEKVAYGPRAITGPPGGLGRGARTAFERGFGGIYPQMYQGGGMIPGAIGQPVPIMAHAGETVIPAGENVPIENYITVPIYLDGEWISETIQRKAGESYLRRQRMGG